MRERAGWEAGKLGGNKIEFQDFRLPDLAVPAPHLTTSLEKFTYLKMMDS
jgi:hypothetical protein